MKRNAEIGLFTKPSKEHHLYFGPLVEPFHILADLDDPVRLRRTAAYSEHVSFHGIVCFRKRNAASADALLSFRPLAENPSHPRGGWSLERAP